MKTFTVITIFPDLIRNYADESILGRGQEAGAIKIEAVNLRDYTTDKHQTVDDSPYGGGPGMVMRVEPWHRALAAHNALSPKAGASTENVHDERTHTVLMSPRGRTFTQRVAEEWAQQYDKIVFVCGRYEGVDHRVVEYCVDEEVSIGDFVLAGGELPALTMIEAVSRLVPGVLGNEESLNEETFGKGEDGQGGEYPQYTRPEQFGEWKVPEILLSGNHAEIAKWRAKNRS